MNTIPVIVGGAAKDSTPSVIVGGVEKTVTEGYVIVGGAAHQFYNRYTAADIDRVEFVLNADTGNQGGGTLTLGSNYASVYAQSGISQSSWYIYIVIITKDGMRWLPTKGIMYGNGVYISYCNAYTTDMFDSESILCNLYFENHSNSSNWSCDRWTRFVSKDLVLTGGANYLSYTETITPPINTGYLSDGYIGLSCSLGYAYLDFYVSLVSVNSISKPYSFALI